MLWKCTVGNGDYGFTKYAQRTVRILLVDRAEMVDSNACSLNTHTQSVTHARVAVLNVDDVRT